MISMTIPRKYLIRNRKVILWLLQCWNSFRLFDILVCAIICTMLFASENKQLDGHYKGYSNYLYKRTSGLVKELFPDRHLLPFQLMSFKKYFRYPNEINLTDLAYRRINKQTIGIRTINKHPFTHIHNPKFLCSLQEGSEKLPLLILIKSSVPHFDLRNAIRKTWGKELRCIGKYRMAFLLGYLHQHQHGVEIEHYLYGDIIQEDFIDTYRNNTHKTIMAWNWASVFCSNAKIVLFLDDDMFLNFSNLRKYISKIDNEGRQDLFTGIVAELLAPVRDIKSKSFVPWHEYPFDNYPKYLAGSAIFASMSVVQRFQAVFPYVRYFDIDDVYLGIVAYKLNIVPTKTPHLDNDNERNIKQLPQLIANHGYKDPMLYRKIYFDILKAKTSCTNKDS